MEHIFRDQEMMSYELGAALDVFLWSVCIFDIFDERVGDISSKLMGLSMMLMRW